ncbi:MAG: DUF4864 domain-containing protein [Rhodobacteraceae bacterium]|nr:DUF4864 domain-containing protein [Paracoccaceae bacterium]
MTDPVPDPTLDRIPDAPAGPRAARRPSRRQALRGLGAALLTAAAGVAVTLPASRAPAQEIAAAARIRETIDRQFDAFRAEDLARAFGYASPSIRRMFGSPENFGRMVREAYPMVWRPGGYAFARLDRIGDGYRQAVVITAADGTTYVADYDMIRIDGAWRIDGVRLRQAPEAGA